MFVEITRGRSFRGLAQYCLHDVGGQSDERVTFIETRNLATTNPQAAWRIMAARHFLQEELKESAGVGRGGPKNGKPVGHLVLSWRKDEAEAQQLNRLGMLNAANGALRAIGASEHQALIVGHNDTEHPHCHVIVNLIGDDGRLKKNWKEREKLSKFALKHEIAVHGEPIVRTREKNWHDREAGESPTPVKKQPRHLYELEKAAADCPQLRVFTETHLTKLALLQQSKARLREQHAEHQQRLLQYHRERLRKLQLLVDSRVRSIRTTTRKAYERKWYKLLEAQSVTRRAFERNEHGLKGALANAMALIDWKDLLRRRQDGQQHRLAEAFRILTSEAVRREQLQHRQQRQRDRLRGKQRKQEQAKEAEVREQQAQLTRDTRRSYARKSQAMKERQLCSLQELKAQQKQLTQERNGELKAHQERSVMARTKRVQEREQANPASEKATDREMPHCEPSTPEQPRRRTRRPRKERLPREPRAKADANRHAVEQSDDQQYTERLVEQFRRNRGDRFHDRER